MFKIYAISQQKQVPLSLLSAATAVDFFLGLIFGPEYEGSSFPQMSGCVQTRGHYNPEGQTVNPGTWLPLEM
jgi:hypothetical protein